MIDPKIKLTVLSDSNGTFADHTEDACDFSRDDFSVTLNSSTSYLYIGFRKPIGGFYVELTTPNQTANTLNAEYYNGTAWVSLTISDSTKGFTRSGYISFDRSVLKPTTVNAVEKTWVRLRPSATHTATVIRGINLVFTDDNALKDRFMEIDNPSILPVGSSSFITAHQAARNEIIEDLRKRGHIKVTSTGVENLDQWDLLDIYQIRQVSIFKALANIFFALADNPQDKWYVQYAKYSDLYHDAINSLSLTSDLNDDGKTDKQETAQTPRSFRFTY